MYFVLIRYSDMIEFDFVFDEVNRDVVFYED